MKNILVPLDLLHSKTDTLLHLQRMLLDGPVCVTLLYVVELNIVPPDVRLFKELREEAKASLRKLARIFFGHEQAVRHCVRVGRPDKQIIAEAGASQAELILMSGAGPRRWHQIFRSHTVERVVRLAPCPTLVLPPDWQTPASQRQPVAVPQKAPRRADPLPHPTWTTWAGA